MKHIIQQIVQELVEKIIKKAYSGKIFDINALTEDVLADCKASAARIARAVFLRSWACCISPGITIMTR